MSEQAQQATARVVVVQDDMVTIEANPGVALVKNSVVQIVPRASGQREWLKAEVLRVHGQRADAQVYEDTRGVAVGDPVYQSTLPLTVTLGPGLLGQVYDGLQNPLEEIAKHHGFFLPRGVDLPALDQAKRWHFETEQRIGNRVVAGTILGSVQEGRFTHRIMAPFDLMGEWRLSWLQAGLRRVDEVVARLENDRGETREVTLQQQWPVRRALAQQMSKQGLCRRSYPDRPLITGQRIIDTFFPVARGGTACIPGPFGAGKTVLQHLIAKHSDVDIVIIVACGERAGEVVETITEFPQLTDPHTGNSLMERTVIICNTSSMPVAAREASIYTGITIGEYYRQMGLNVLLIADSTSRWAQALRETSGRLEEIPGEEAFPAYIDSSIRSLYERAGVLQLPQGDSGSLTMIGTVSPAGGNFDEPVTQSTLRSVKTFLGLSSERAYRRCYPAIDPLISWSRYHEQLSAWYREHLGAEWSTQVSELTDLLRRGEEINRMMQVTGEEGVSFADYLIYLKADLLDRVYLQQDAFDAVDASSSLERQHRLLQLVRRVLAAELLLNDKDALRERFKKLASLLKNLSYEREGDPGFQRLQGDIEAMLGDPLAH